MSSKRMRIFGGPNGSGKTTIIRNLNAEIPFGVYVNADDIERTLASTKSLSFDAYQIQVNEEELRQFFQNQGFSSQKREQPDLAQMLFVNTNFLTMDTDPDSYLAADLAAFIRQQLLVQGISFTFETVMSHESKVAFMKQARLLGYRVYLYFMATEDPEINVSRVGVRVAQHGHPVNPEIVKNRYFRSMRLLKEAVKQTNRAYIFDNSGIAASLIAEITNGEEVHIIDPKHVPEWFYTYLVD